MAPPIIRNGSDEMIPSSNDVQPCDAWTFDALIRPMTRDDWTLISVRFLGLYLIATYLGSFITAVSTLIIVLSQSPDYRNMPITTWQAPIVTTIALTIGCVLVSQSRSIATVLQKADKKQ
jgi:hypothetical protein